MFFDVMNSISPKALSDIQKFHEVEFANSPKPLDIQELVYFFGLQIKSKETGNSPGSIQFDSRLKRFEILIQPDLSEEEKRFTIAHELSHYLLHEDIIIKRGSMDMNMKIQNEEIESQANRLAAYILMPMEQVYKMGINNLTKEKLANQFGIPIDTVGFGIE